MLAEENENSIESIQYFVLLKLSMNYQIVKLICQKKSKLRSEQKVKSALCVSW